MGCGEFLVKYILFFANLLFALAGLVLLGVGVAVQLQASPIVQIADWNFQVAPISSMVVGGIVFFVAFFGCCGAIRESNCMLVTYSIFMLVLMIAKITLATLIFINLDTLETQVSRWLMDSFNKDQTSLQPIEESFKCCGPTGPGSYPNPLVLPTSCCGGTSPCTSVNAYAGCDVIIQDFFNTFGLVIGVVAISIVAIELVAVVFGLCLANHVRNKSRRARY